MSSGSSLVGSIPSAIKVRHLEGSEVCCLLIPTDGAAIHMHPLKKGRCGTEYSKRMDPGMMYLQKPVRRQSDGKHEKRCSALRKFFETRLRLVLYRNTFMLATAAFRRIPTRVPYSSLLWRSVYTGTITPPTKCKSYGYYYLFNFLHSLETGVIGIR
jgi:hypothetical protein